MSESAQMLKEYADHFARRDWQYTRLHNIKHIRYADDYKGYDHPLKRLRRTFFPSRSSRRLGRMLRSVRTWDWKRPVESIKLVWWTLKAHVVVGLRTDSNRPDGVLNGGGVITHWEEDGEYIQLVQPSVGSLLADFLMEEPEHPHAQLIVAEIDRIRADYSERCRAGKVDGREEAP